jgi:phage terminase large subunit GpA-like protein
MNWLDDPFVRQITIAKASQVGGSELCNIFIGYTADVNPAPTLICMPREDDANRRLATRIRPMFKANPGLLKHLPHGRIDGLNIGKETILDNMILFIAWSNSPAALADNPVANIILDEVGKYPPSSGREADPISLAKKRQRTFRSRSKLIIPSTPVADDDLLDAEFKKGDQCEWWVPCEKCGRWHKIDWFNVKLDKSKDGKLLEPDEYEKGGHAIYVCPHCGDQWDDYRRFDAVSKGQFVPLGGAVDENGGTIGTVEAGHHSCRITCVMLHPVFQTMDDLAVNWAQANIAKHEGNILPLQDFFNSQLALPWRQTEQTTEMTIIKRHITGRESGIVPLNCKMITAGVDVQKDHVWVILLGWGHLSECWIIWAGRLETGDTSNLGNYELVRKFAASRWPIEGKKEETPRVMRIAATAVDCGAFTDTVTDFTLQCTESNVMAVRGDDKVKNTVYHVFKLPDKKTVRYDLNITILKDRLFRLLFESDKPGPGFMHIPKDMPADYMRHFVSEEKRNVRTARYKLVVRWVKKHGTNINHLWDAAVYASFAAEIMGARLITEEDIKYRPMKIIGRPVAREHRIRTKY